MPTYVLKAASRAERSLTVTGCNFLAVNTAQPDRNATTCLRCDPPNYSLFNGSVSCSRWCQISVS